MTSYLNNVDLTRARQIYEKSADSIHVREFSQVVDGCFSAVVEFAKQHEPDFQMIGDDRAEHLVAAIAQYLIECGISSAPSH